jgi:hypothetical protein
MYLHYVLARVTVGLAHECQQNFVQDPSALRIPDAAMVEGVGTQ